jgi:GntR family transcriptional regulator
VNLIDYQDPRPIYEQITEQYKLLVLKGVLSPGEQMPSVRKLAMELAANPNTVQRAYAELERQGIIYTVKGKGSFVSGNISLKEQKKRELRERLQRIVREAGEIGIGLDELMEDLGKDTEAAVASAGAEAAGTSEGGG